MMRSQQDMPRLLAAAQHEERRGKEGSEETDSWVSSHYFVYSEQKSHFGVKGVGNYWGSSLSWMSTALWDDKTVLPLLIPHVKGPGLSQTFWSWCLMIPYRQWEQLLVVWTFSTLTACRPHAVAVYVILLPIPDSLGGKVFAVKPDDRCVLLGVSCRAPNAQSNGAVISTRVQPACFAVT